MLALTKHGLSESGYTITPNLALFDANLTGDEVRCIGFIIHRMRTQYDAGVEIYQDNLSGGVWNERKTSRIIASLKKKKIIKKWEKPRLGPYRRTNGERPPIFFLTSRCTDDVHTVEKTFADAPEVEISEGQVWPLTQEDRSGKFHGDLSGAWNSRNTTLTAFKKDVSGLKCPPGAVFVKWPNVSTSSLREVQDVPNRPLSNDTEETHHTTTRPDNHDADGPADHQVDSSSVPTLPHPSRSELKAPQLEARSIRTTTETSSEECSASGLGAGDAPASVNGMEAVHDKLAMLGFCSGSLETLLRRAVENVIMEVSGVVPSKKFKKKQAKAQKAPELNDGKTHPEEKYMPKKRSSDVGLRLLVRRHTELMKKHLDDSNYTPVAKDWNQAKQVLSAMFDGKVNHAIPFVEWCFENWRTAIPKKTKTIGEIDAPSFPILIAFRVPLMQQFSKTKKRQKAVAASKERRADLAKKSLENFTKRAKAREERVNG